MPTDDKPPPKHKLYHVTCEIEIDMVVLAENDEQAKRLGEKYWYEEMSNASLSPSTYHAMEVRHRRDLGYLEDRDLETIPPWGPDGIWENGSSSPQRSIFEYMEERGIKR
jgi:hypothetical protein